MILFGLGFDETSGLMAVIRHSLIGRNSMNRIPEQLQSRLIDLACGMGTIVFLILWHCFWSSLLYWINIKDIGRVNVDFFNRIADFLMTPSSARPDCSEQTMVQRRPGQSVFSNIHLRPQPFRIWRSPLELHFHNSTSQGNAS